MSARRFPTYTAALRAVDALDELHRVCAAIDADNRDYRSNDHAYQAAMRAAEAALCDCPQLSQEPTP